MTTELHPIFAACRANPKAIVRRRMDKSWVKGGFIYSTDGRVCVRGATTEGDTPGDWPDTSPLNWKQPGEAVSIPEIDPAWLTEVCDECQGKGTVTDCPECDGTGETTCPHCDNGMDCDECHGTGVAPGGKPIECPKCHGAKTQETGRCVPVGHALANVRYADILRRCGVATVRPGPTPKSPIAFSGDGFEGLLMPMDPRAVSPEKIMPTPTQESSHAD